MPDINPTSMAQQLASAYTQDARALLDSQTQATQTRSSGLAKLQSALQAFDSAIAAMSTQKSVLERSASFATGYGSASADATAQPGSYSFFIEQLASAQQLAYQNIAAVPAAGAGSLGVQLAGGGSFSVNLAAADQDGDGSLSPTEIARAINQAAANAGQVSASLVTSGGQTRLLLAAGESGAASAITLDTSAVGAAALQASLDAPTEIAAARDAIFWLGDQGSGLRIDQASNSFNGIAGVSLQFSKAMTPGEAPITLKVSADDGGTAANVKGFVDAYNTLEKALDELTKAANADAGSAGGPFSSDASVRALRSRISAALRQQVGGLRLADYGIRADRNGSLTLDNTKLAAGLAAQPDGLDALFGSTSLSTPSGILGEFDSAIDVWTRAGTGQVQQRQNSLQVQQKALAARQTTLDDRYQQLYQRYLAQFTRLQTLQASMSQTGSLFTNLAAEPAR